MHSFPEVISCKIAFYSKRQRLCIYFPFCMWDIVCFEFQQVMCMLSQSLNSYVHLLSCVWNTLFFFWSCSPLSGFIVFTFLFWNMSLSLEWGGCGRLATRDLELSTSESFTLHIVLLQVIILCTVCQRVPIELLLEHLKLLPLLLDFLYNFIIRPFC